MKIERVLDFGKINLLKQWGNLSARKSNEVVITVALNYDRNGNLKFNATADVYDAEKNQILLHCDDDFNELKAFTELMNDKMFLLICELKEKYDGKTIYTGTPNQIALIKQAVANGILQGVSNEYYPIQCEYLKYINQYYETLDNGIIYHYGQGYILNQGAIPDNDSKNIQRLFQS